MTYLIFLGEIAKVCYLFRLATMVTILVFSLNWKYGVLISTFSICLLLFTIPSLAMLYNKYTRTQTSLADRSSVFMPFPSFKFVEDPNKIADKIIFSRMYNKFVVFILILVVVAMQILNWQEVIHFIDPDLW